MGEIGDDDELIVRTPPAAENFAWLPVGVCRLRLIKIQLGLVDASKALSGIFFSARPSLFGNGWPSTGPITGRLPKAPRGRVFVVKFFFFR